MEAMLESCAGLDVHKATVVACVRRKEGSRVRSEVRTFETTTRALKALAEWMGSQGVTHVAMESTGVYWKPVFNILEGRFEILLCNAQHIKQVPGRKTDVKDCEWIAQLLEHGLLRGSFVPPRVLRDLRDLTRHQAQVVGEKTRAANRIQKILEDANVKLASVATDTLGVSGRAMLEAMLAGERDPAQLAEMARGRLRAKLPELRLALESNLTGHHVFMLRTLYEHLRYLERTEEALDRRIEEVMAEADREVARGSGTEAPLPFAEALSLAKTAPGVAQRAGQAILAEIGTDMSRFPTPHNLASWAGICPGHDESAGKRRRGKTRKGNRWLRRTLVQCAWAASRTKNTYFAAAYRRLAARRGKKRALVAVAHALLVAMHGMLKNRCPYRDLGADYFDRLDPVRLTRYHVRRLEALGHTVLLDPPEKAAS